VSSTYPFAGTAVPAEGVSHWLGDFLRTTTLEQGLIQLLEQFADDSPAPIAIWVWPQPQIAAVGIIGTSRFYEVRQQEFDGSTPQSGDLARWSFPQTDPSRIEIRLWPADLAHRSGALCWERSDHPEPSADQIAWLGTLLDWLSIRENQLLDAKLKSLAEFAGGAGHEINNPLGTILGRSQLLLRQEVDPERRRWLTAIGGQALRIRDMISDTMVFACPPAPKTRAVELEPLIRSVTDRFADELRSAKIQLQIKLVYSEPTGCSTLNPQHPTLLATLDPEQFQVVCIELLRNAIRAVGQRADQNRRIILRARNRNWQGRLWLELDLYNTGPELTPAERTHAFDPFFSGRDAGRGLGFGLTKCWRIVTGHGGRMGVHSTSDRTVFRTLWPTPMSNSKE